MKNITLLFFIAVALSTFFGCKKGADAKDLTGKVKILQSTFSGLADSRDSFVYNTDGNIQEIVRGAGGGTTYTYDDATHITEAQYNGAGDLIQTTKWHLNSDGLVDSATLLFGGNYSYEVFRYDNGGHKVHMDFYTAAHTLDAVYDWVITNGNSTNYNYTDELGNFLGGQTTVFNDKLNSIGTEQIGQSFLGKASKNLPVSAQQSIGGSTNNYTWTYTFDSQGRMATSIQNDGSGNPVITQVVTYY